MINGGILQGKDLSKEFWAEIGVDPALAERIVITIDGPQNAVKLEIKQLARLQPVSTIADR